MLLMKLILKKRLTLITNINIYISTLINFSGFSRLGCNPG